MKPPVSAQVSFHDSFEKCCKREFWCAAEWIREGETLIELKASRHVVIYYYT